jgi:hypothetical protein
MKTGGLGGTARPTQCFLGTGCCLWGVAALVRGEVLLTFLGGQKPGAFHRGTFCAYVMNLCNILFLLEYSYSAWLIFGTNFALFSLFGYGNHFLCARGGAEFPNRSGFDRISGAPSRR